MNKRISLGAAIAVMIIVATLTFTITRVQTLNDFNSRVTDLKEREQEFEKFAEIDRTVRTNYLFGIDDTKLMDYVARGYLEGVEDKYATYISAEEYKRLTQSDNDSVGIGAVVEVSADDYYLEVIEVYDDSPAQVAGIEPGDLIVKIDDVDLTRENSRQMLESISGSQGSRITMVLRRGSQELPMVEMIRRAVAVPTVESHMMAQQSDDEPLVGYIRIMEFDNNTYNQFNRELQRLTDAGAQALVFDVRDNKGGVLRSATRILDKLLPDGVLVTSTDRAGVTEVLYTSDANEVKLPMTVLVNNGTASAAELFALSIRDYDKGRIVGVTTQGKGVMQEMIPLSDGSAISLTVAFYHSRSGTAFNDIGISPDYELKMDGDWTVLDDTLDTQRVKAKEVAISLLRQTESIENEASGSDGEPDSGEEQDGAEPAEPNPIGEVGSSASDGSGDADENGDNNSSEEPSEEDTPSEEESGEDE